MLEPIVPAVTLFLHLHEARYIMFANSSKPPSRSSMRLVSIAFLLFGLSITYMGGKAFLDSRALIKRGVLVDATVTDQRQTEYRRNDINYYITYTFKDKDGHSHYGDQNVSPDIWRQAAPASTVPVVYLADAPQVSALGANAETRYGRLLFGLGLLALAALSLAMGKTPSNSEEACTYVIKRLDAFTAKRDPFENTDLSQFGEWDLPFYNTSQQELEAMGFHFLGDRNPVGTPLTFLRHMVRNEDDTIVAIGHIRPNRIAKLAKIREVRVVELETVFSDQSFICTSTNASNLTEIRDPRIDFECVSSDTSIAELVQRHVTRINERLAQREDLHTLKVSSLEQLELHQHTFKAISARFKKKNELIEFALNCIHKDPTEEDRVNLLAEVDAAMDAT